MVTYLNENQWNVHYHKVGDRYFVLTSRYSFAFHILTTWSCLELLIVNVISQINWHSCQKVLFGISKQALDFVEDGKIPRPIWIFSKKCLLYNTRRKMRTFCWVRTVSFIIYLFTSSFFFFFFGGGLSAQNVSAPYENPRPQCPPPPPLEES